jgi:hypothetical protein
VASCGGSPGASLATRQHSRAALLLGALVFAYLWPVLVGGKILSPIANLYGSVPWRGSAPSDLRDYFNSLLVDLPLVDYPWRFLARSLIHEGTFPAWNPYVLGGIPLYSNPQIGIFSVFSLPLWILPLTYALGVSAALKLLVGAFGTYLLARRLRLDFLPGLLAGIAFAFSAINIVWLAHETLPGVAVMLPWTIWLVEGIFERGRLASALGLAVAVAIGLGGGHPGMQVHLLTVIPAYALARAACTRRVAPHAGDGPSRRRALALVAGGLAAGVLLMAFMLIPEARSSHDTVGVFARQNQSLPGAKLPFTVIRTVLFPDWWGRPSAIEASDLPSSRIPSGNYCERTFYAGAVALLFACLALLSPGQWRRKAPFALIGVLALAIALRAPGLHWLVMQLPIVEAVEPGRIHFAFGLAVAVLGAFGLQAMLDAPRGHRRWLLAPLAVVVVGALALGTTGARAGDAGRTLRHFLTGADFASSGVIAITSVVWFLLFALGVAAALLLARRYPRRRVAIAAAVVLLAAGDAYHFVDGFQPMGPEAKVIPPVTPAIAYLVRHRADGRIVGVNDALPNDWGLVYGLKDARGYDPPQPTRRMLELWRLANPDQNEWQPSGLSEISARGLQALSVLGVRYIVLAPGYAAGDLPSGALRQAYLDKDATIVENTRAAPRALVPTDAIVTPNERASRRVIGERRFDPRTMVVVERGQPGVSALADASRHLPHTRGSIAIVRERNSSVSLSARLHRRGLVMLDDSLLEGWRVRIDGHGAPALRVDGVMRGVIVPAGRHEIVWTYAVPGLRLGALLSLLTLVGLAGTGGVLVARARPAARRRGP